MAFVQSAGSGTTLFRSPVQLDGAGGFNFSGTNLDFSNVTDASTSSLSTASGGPVNLAHAGTLFLRDSVSLADTGLDYIISGSFSQDGTAGQTLLSGDLSAVGDVSFARPVQLGGNVQINSTAGDVLFLGAAATIDDDGTANPSNLGVNSAGTTRFDGAVGAVSALSSLSTDSAGTTLVNGGSISTSGVQNFLDPVVLGATTVFRTQASTINYGAALNANNNNITLHADIAAAADRKSVV